MRNFDARPLFSAFFFVWGVSYGVWFFMWTVLKTPVDGAGIIQFFVDDHDPWTAFSLEAWGKKHTFFSSVNPHVYHL